MIARILIASSALALVVACGEAETQVTPEPTPTPEMTPTETPTPEPMPEEVMFEEFSTTGPVVGADGGEIGTLTVTGGPIGTVIKVELGEGALTPGWHGLHLHQVADCSDVGQFTLSGGHVGKVEGGHGLLNPEGPEAGDIPNIWAAADGSAGYEAFTTLAGADELMDEDGTALIIHEGPDDMLTQPIGGAGSRVACGLIQ